MNIQMDEWKKDSLLDTSSFNFRRLNKKKSQKL